MRKRGDNDKPVSGPFENWIGDPLMAPNFDGNRSIDIWQRYASPVWMDIDPGDTLQYTHVRTEKDERHICPLQLGVIRRCIELWSNPGDVVFSPFAGIGSEGYVALQEGRKFVGIELKREYYDWAVKNLKAAESAHQMNIFAPTEIDQ
jgi:DNA modification methylase